MRKIDLQTIFLAAVVLVCLTAGTFWVISCRSDQLRPTATFDGQRSYQFLVRICELGPRPSGSPGMAAQQQLLEQHFRQLGGQVRRQTFAHRHPENGARVEMANLIVQWHPERAQRILLCAHYDTRPFPDADPDVRRRRDPFVGANDGASGVAVLCELAYHMPGLRSRYGVDFVLFDAEEFVFDGQRDPYFLGSEAFAREYRGQPPPHRYRWGVLLDMVGDAQLQLYPEANSLKYASTLVRDLWNVAQRLGVSEFKFRRGHEIRDDHLPLNEIARIPTCDVIDFDYPRPGLSYWHTIQDTPDKCSAESLQKVGQVLLVWLQQLK